MKTSPKTPGNTLPLCYFYNSTKRAEIDIGALEGNYRVCLERLRQTAPNVRIISVVKADGYGHGSNTCVWSLLEAGCDFLTTQMFFDNNLLYNFLYKIREEGITVPVMPGIMPITNANQVERAIKLSGSFMPQRFKSLVDKFGTSPDAMKQAGIIYATDQIIDLFANGIKNVHVYSMNKPDVAEKILNNLSDILN